MHKRRLQARLPDPDPRRAGASPLRGVRSRAHAWRACGCAALAAAVFGCAQNPPSEVHGAPAAAPAEPARAPATPSAFYSMFHRPLNSPEGAAEALRMHAEGVEIFRCESRSGAMRWVHRLPEAQLKDAGGKESVRYGAEQTFEHADGSRLSSEVIDHVPSPDDTALPWLLLKTRSFGKGSLAGVSYVQRINTAGGMPPDHCDASQANQLLRVEFAADFVFFR
jgi:hypothetical protein